MTAAVATAPRCARTGCLDPDGSGCLLGSAIEECPHYRQGVPAPDSAGADILDATVQDEDDAAVPWTGSALGATDLSMVAATARLIVVAVVGPYNAGKTTALASAFHALRRSGRLGRFTFGGSWTLAGWQVLAKGMPFSDRDAGAFPEHTTTSGRFS
jgi:hypothetical protein